MKNSRKSASVTQPLSLFQQAATHAGLTCEAGKQAVQGRYRADITTRNTHARLTGSIDVDAAFQPSEPQSPRWDYGLGVADVNQAECAVWVEPHSGGSAGEVKVVLAKLQWLKGKLGQNEFAPLRALTAEAVRQGKQPYIWLSSGTVAIRPGSREAMLLSTQGMGLPVTRVVI